MISSAEKEWSSHVRNTQLKKRRITCRDKGECIKLEDYYGTDSNKEKFSLSATDLSYLDDACSCKHFCRVHNMVTKGVVDWDLHIMYDCDGKISIDRETTFTIKHFIYITFKMLKYKNIKI